MTKLIHNCIKYILRHNTQAKYLFDYKIDNNLMALHGFLGIEREDWYLISLKK